jgi:tetratricopeptide (TPR) repeat protein
MGLSYLALGKPQKAVVPLERALALREKNDPQADHLGETRFALARALWDAGGNRNSALRLAVRARDDYRTLSFPSTNAKLAEIATWLASHPVPKRAP